jgi:hypothetical protein
MNKGQTFRTVGAALLTGVTLAACGGGGGGGGGGAKAPSALDPANMVPASAMAYADVTIRPQGSVKSDLIEAINSVGGSGAADKLRAGWAKSVDQWKKIEPLLGQHLGIALTGLPASPTQFRSITDDLLIVIPSNDPSAAQRELQKGTPPSWEASKIEGHYVLAGGKTALAAAEATTAKTSLAADSSFTAAMSQLGSGELLTAYVPLHQLYQAVLPLLQKLPAYSGTSAATELSAGAKQAPPGSSVAFGVSALHNQFRMDVVENGVPHTSTPINGVSSDVSSLPGGSWLALTLGGALAKGSDVTAMTSNLSKELAALESLSAGAGAKASGPLQFVVKDLLPALGPAELTVSGTSSATLQAGLLMAPDNKSAGPRLVKGIRQLISGLPISARTATGRVAVTFGFSNLQQLVSPSTKLSGNPTFKHALAQLPSGAKADVYLNFAPITALASLDQGVATPSAMKVLHRLDYLIAGGTHSHFRLVLATF